MKRVWQLCCCLSMLGSALAAEGSPDLGMRDPTQLPPALQQAVGGGARDGQALSGPDSEALAQPFFIMSHGGRLVVIHKAHRLNVGDELDNARIVRIASDAVWLREDGLVRRVSIYPDVIKRPVAKPVAPLASPHSASSRPTHRRPRTTKKDAP